MDEKKKPFSILLIDPNGLNSHLLTQRFSKEISNPTAEDAPPKFSGGASGAAGVLQPPEPEAEGIPDRGFMPRVGGWAKPGPLTQLDLAKSIPDALEKLARRTYQMILADCHSLDGAQHVEEVLRTLRQERKGTPLIVFVERGEEAEGRRALKAGATDFIVKEEKELRELPAKLWNFYRTYELTHQKTELHNEIAADQEKLTEINDKLRKLSIRDELTGIFNHRYFQERLHEEFDRSLRYGHPISCLLLDLDLFRRVNENLGHAVGDEILKETSALLAENSRLSDLVGRFGGEEFVLLSPHVDYEGAQDLANRIRELFSEHIFLPESHRLSLTVSIGVASFPEDAIRHRTDLLNFADQALFRAKAGGRNRVYLYRNVMPTIGETLPHLKMNEERVLEFQKRLTDIMDHSRRGYIESSKAMMAALESKDHYTAGHAGNVARTTLQVAEALGLPLEEAEVVEHAGLLHDIGKICISDSILLKEGRLTHAEYEAMKHHPYFGYRIVKPIKFLQAEATLILHHHEWYNGEGYPCRLAKTEIPLGARIIAIVDSYDTMRLSGGRYKKTMPVEEAVNELIRCAGKQFDPAVVQVFIQVLLLRRELAPDSYNKKELEATLSGTLPH